MNLSFDENFKTTVQCLKIHRCHPAMQRDKKWLFHFVPTFSVYTLVFLLILYNITLNLKMNDFDQTCKNGVLSVVYVVITFQQIILLWKKDRLLNLITCMNEDYETMKSLPPDEQKIMYDYIEKGKHVCKQWLAISFIGFGVFPLKNVILLIYYYAIGEPKLIPMYDLVYLGVIEKNKENILLYLVIYVILMFYGIYTGCMYTAFVPLGPIFMLHLSGQLEIIEKKIESIFENEADIEEKLREVIMKLQYIYSFADKIVLSFRVNYEMTLKATTIILPINCYEVIEAFNKGELSLEFITFIVGGVLISSSPCYYSNLLIDKSENVRLAIYSNGWETNYKPKAWRVIKIILLRALNPVAIRTPFRTLCLEALTDLFQQSYTIFNLMNAMWK